jgi:hypothetical protein
MTSFFTSLEVSCAPECVAEKVGKHKRIYPVPSDRSPTLYAIRHRDDTLSPEDVKGYFSAPRV